MAAAPADQPPGHVTVREEGSALRIGGAISPAVPPKGIACAEILTTHAFEIGLQEPVGDRDVVLSVDG